LHAQSLASAFCNEPEKSGFADGAGFCCRAVRRSQRLDQLQQRTLWFYLQYPADVFVPERSAEAGDGELFAAKDGDARLLVGTLSNASRFTPASYQAYITRNCYADYRIDYRRLRGSWFALSGEGNGKIFYEKAMFSCAGRLITGFAMIYRSEQRQLFDRHSFRPGRKC
jgi:hypothetical protein